jgi:hypothetical protein
LIVEELFRAQTFEANVRLRPEHCSHDLKIADQRNFEAANGSFDQADQAAV